MQNLSYSGAENAEPFMNIAFAGDIRCKTLTINTITLTNLAMRAAGGKGILDIDPVRMDIFGGSGTGKPSCGRHRGVASLSDDHCSSPVQDRGTDPSLLAPEQFPKKHGRDGKLFGGPDCSGEERR